jgi:hypothetical protein
MLSGDDRLTAPAMKAKGFLPRWLTDWAERDSGRGPLLEFNVGSHPGDSTHYVNAKDMLSLSLLQARLIDLRLPIKIVEGEWFLMWIKARVRQRTAILIGEH